MGSITRSESLKIHRNYERTAEVASLVYVNDSSEGIRREKKGSGFAFTFKGSTVKDADTLQRIKKLAIPPAWTNVWICGKKNGHIQATGRDLRGRKQYKYHHDWSSIRNETKFIHLYEFGKALPRLREKIHADLAKSELTKEKVLATVAKLMEHTFIRIGNSGYEKLYGSYGLTTMKDGHVKINGALIKFSFKGKKGIYHTITLRNKKLAKIVRACRDIPGKELFQYINDERERCSIDSGMVNSYIQEATGSRFSAKDFRTWAGTLSMLECFKSLGECTTPAEIKKNVLAAIDWVSEKLGNTRAVCRKYYIHPTIISLYEENKLLKYIKEVDETADGNDDGGLTGHERVLMKILKNN